MTNTEPTRVAVCCLFRAYGGTAAALPLWLGEWQRQIAGRRLPVELIVYTCPQNVEFLREACASGVRIVEVALAERGILGRAVAESLVLPFLLWRDRIRVILGAANTIPWPSPCRSIVVFQNAAPFVKQAYNSGPLSFRLRMRLLRWAILWTARRSDRIICISAWFKKVLASHVPQTQNKTAVIRHGVAEAAEGTEVISPEVASLCRGRRFILCVSHAYPYKNLVELIEGFDLALARLPEEPWRLVIAGELLVPSYQLLLEQAISRSERLEKFVVLAGRVTEAEVQWLTRCCDVFAFSSCCENWPVALMNALAAGAPIACSDFGVMPEVAGDAAVMFDPFSPPAIAEALVKLMSSEEEREAYRAKSLARASEFPSANQQAAEILDEICALGGITSAPRRDDAARSEGEGCGARLRATGTVME